MTSDEYGELHADALDGNEDLTGFVTPTRRAQATRVIRLLRTNARRDAHGCDVNGYVRGYVQGRRDLAIQLLDEMGIR